MSKFQIVQIPKQGLAENIYTSGNNSWAASNLIQWCKERRFPDDHGYIADGWHRVIKALVEGRQTIKAIRIQEMPEPDGVDRCTDKP